MTEPTYEIDESKILEGEVSVATIPPGNSLRITIHKGIMQDSQNPIPLVVSHRMKARAFEKKIMIIGDAYEYEIKDGKLIITFV